MRMAMAALSPPMKAMCLGLSSRRRLAWRAAESGSGSLDMGSAAGEARRPALIGGGKPFLVILGGEAEPAEAPLLSELVGKAALMCRVDQKLGIAIGDGGPGGELLGEGEGCALEPLGLEELGHHAGRLCLGRIPEIAGIGEELGRLDADEARQEPGAAAVRRKAH